MDLGAGAKRLWVLMDHTDKQGRSKLVSRCTYPLTALGTVGRVYTDLAVLDVEGGAFVVRSLAPGVSLEDLRARTDAPLRDGTAIAA